MTRIAACGFANRAARRARSDAAERAFLSLTPANPLAAGLGYAAPDIPRAADGTRNIVRPCDHDRHELGPEPEMNR